MIMSHSMLKQQEKEKSQNRTQVIEDEANQMGNSQNKLNFSKNSLNLSHHSRFQSGMQGGSFLSLNMRTQQPTVNGGELF